MVKSMKSKANAKVAGVCKWCGLGECWSHGQIEKPAGAEGGVKKAATKNTKKKNKRGGNGGGMPSPQGGMGGQQTKVMQQMMQMFKGPGGQQQAQVVQQMMQVLMGKAGGKGGSDVKGGQGQESPKGTLHNLFNEAGDCVYNHEEQDGKWIATLTINSLGRQFKGAVGQNKKEAVANAANKALKDGQVRKMVKDAQEERAATKKEKTKAWSAEKKRKAAEKAQAQAE